MLALEAERRKAQKLDIENAILHLLVAADHLTAASNRPGLMGTNDAALADGAAELRDQASEIAERWNITIS